MSDTHSGQVPNWDYKYISLAKIVIITVTPMSNLAVQSSTLL